MVIGRAGMRNKPCWELEEIRSKKQVTAKMWNLSCLTHFFLKISTLMFIPPALTQALVWAGVQVLRDLQGSLSVWFVAEKPVLRSEELLAAALGNRRKESEIKK